MQWLKKERCRVCSDERAVRYCLRRNKELGWSCCNSYRADGKCPEACPYYPKKEITNSLLPQIKSDSRTEFLDYLDRYLQFWIHVPIAELDKLSPNDLCQSAEGKARLTSWLNGFTFQDNGILALLNKKLNLAMSLPEDKALNTETLALQYLDAVIEQNWDKVAGFHLINREPTAESKAYCEQQLSTHLLLKKIKSRSIVNSGFTEDLKQAFVYCELNGKENWTFIFMNTGEQWQLYQTIWGTLQDYYNQKTLFREIAVAISQKDETALYNRFYSLKNTYPLSADIQYYWGLYYGLCQRIADAKTAFNNALMIEPHWQEPLFQLAFVYMNLKEFDTALTYWHKLAALNSKDINVQNNIGVCYMGLNQPDQAKAVWQAALLIDPASEILKKNLDHFNG